MSPRYADKRVRVKFSGGRESKQLLEKYIQLLDSTDLSAVYLPVEGTLKGWDQLLNLVLDDIEELIVGTCGQHTLAYTHHRTLF
jgi:small nuclear ribonucleoprotein (snRNP)-like protein